jgi:hypothetical protein
VTAAYHAFLERKTPIVEDWGLQTIPPLHRSLKPFQRDIVAWALRRGRAAIFAGTGLGKTLQQLCWAQEVHRHTQGPVLIFTPLAVAQQTVAEAAKFFIPGVAYAKDADDISTPITVTNYDRLDRFDPREFAGVVLDECFAAGTLIDVVQRGNPSQKHIENIRVGDSIVNASGIDSVADVHRREVSYGIKVTAGSASYIASPNHPFFTQRGWTRAQTLRAGDRLLESAAAVRLVRDGISPGNTVPARAEILRQVLLSEMEDEHFGTQGEGTRASGGGKAGCGPFGVAAVGYAGGIGSDRAHSQAQPHVVASDAREAIPHIESDEPQNFRAWGQRAWLDEIAGGLDGCSVRQMGAGICLVTGATHTRVSDALQARLGGPDTKAGDRIGWSLAPSAPHAGREENSESDFARVDAIEILELGHPELDRLRDADGKLYFYDIRAARHPSFSVSGRLVHNSSIIKSHDSKTRVALIDACAETPWRLSCTATPAPNDYIELGNHAEFLGVMREKEMLAMFFVHDGSVRAGGGAEWRLKRHAERDFWQWLASWAVMIRSPADLGYDDPQYILPPLVKHPVTVPVEYKPQPYGTLFPMEACTLSERIAAKRESIEARVIAAAAIVNAKPDRPWLIWCRLNDEADAMERAIPGAMQVTGSDERELKAARLLGFCSGQPRVLVSKASIAGHGMNWQHCADMVFVGIDDSFESLFQAIRRCWRFGQLRPVNVYLIASELEGAVVSNIEAKERDFERMCDEMAVHMRELTQRVVRGGRIATDSYRAHEAMKVPEWMM